MLGAFKFQLASRGPPIGAAGQLNLPTPSWTLESVWEGAPDYPRVCGATDSTTHVWPLPRGLSPRVRGNPSPVLLPPLAARSIPRVCGATETRKAAILPPFGLSPRVRGNLDHGPSAASSGGSIPACAGQPSGYRRIAMRARVYPRVCGATCRLPQDILMVMGLSPRVRGNPPTNSEASTRPGSIPACAGQPSGWRGRSRRSRSIPACAGQPLSGLGDVVLAQVYPRVCGATVVLRIVGVLIMGLSPRVRGNQRIPRGHLPVAGSIPACAGQPSTRVITNTPSRFYPRVCGATLSLVFWRAPIFGLSPRVRGNLE